MDLIMLTNNQNIDKNELYTMFETMVELFEQYENLLKKTNFNQQQLDTIYNKQVSCLSIVESIFAIEETEHYFNALMNLRDDLLKQMHKIEILRQQITINDITIIKLNNQNPLPNFEIINNENNKQNGSPMRKKVRIADKTIDTQNRSNYLLNIIEKTLIIPASNGLTDIAGLQKEKSVLKEAIIYPILYPHLFTGNRKRWNKALLYGPPGTGKTHLAHCLAAEVGANFYNVSSADLLSRYVGESENLIKLLFEYCQNGSQYNIIFIDEIDSLCRIRNGKENEFERRIKNELLNQLSAMDRNPNNKIFFLACTNCPWDIDSAFIRRFQRRIYIPLPDRKTRLEILKMQTKSCNNVFYEVEWEEILNKTEGWSGSDLTDLTNCAMYQPLKDLETATHWVLTEDNNYMPTTKKHFSIEKNITEIPPNRVTVRRVEINDFFTAFNEVTKTVSTSNLLHFEKFNDSFGTIFKN